MNPAVALLVVTIVGSTTIGLDRGLRIRRAVTNPRRWVTVLRWMSAGLVLTLALLTHTLVFGLAAGCFGLAVGAVIGHLRRRQAAPER